MSETTRLAQALATDVHDESHILRWLRWTGFRGYVAGLEAHLVHLGALHPPLKRLGELYPGLQPACDELNWSGELRRRLQAFVGADGDRAQGALLEPQPWEAYRTFDTRLPGGWIEPIMEPQWPLPELSLPPTSLPAAMGARSLLLYTAAMVSGLVWDTHRDRLQGSVKYAWPIVRELRKNLSWPVLWPTVETMPEEFREKWKWTRIADFDARALRAPPDPLRMEPAVDIEHARIDDVVEYIQQGIKLRRKGEPFSESKATWKVTSAWAQFCELLERTVVDGACIPHLRAEPSSTDEVSAFAQTVARTVPRATPRLTGRRWGDGHSVDRSDRELLSEHRIGLTQETLERLQGPTGRTTLDRLQRPDTFEALVDVCAGYLLSVALSTGQTVAEAAMARVIAVDVGRPVPLDEHAEANGLLVLRPDFGGRRVTSWLPPGSPDVETLFELAEPPEWPLYARDFFLYELFPGSRDELLPHIEQRVAQALKCAEGTSNLIVKHALAQSMYAYNANRGAIHVVCGPGRTGMERTSLHHYIDRRSAAIRNAYAYAQRRLFRSPFDRFTPEVVSDESACLVLPAGRLRPVLQRLRDRINDPAITDPKVRHNRFTDYVAVIMVLPTGHREQKQLFHFPFSVDVAEALAFLADKQKAGSEARFVALAKLSLAQYLEYLQHLLWLVDELEAASDPLVQEVRIACGLEMPTTPRGANAPGMLFRFHGEALVPVSSDSVSRILSEIERELGATNVEEITAKTLRRNLATFVSEVGASGIDVERLLGHCGEQHPLGPGGNRAHLWHLEHIRPLLDRYLAVTGGTFQPAHWVMRRKRPFVVAPPRFASSGEAFEGRALMAEAARARARAAVRSAISMDDLESGARIELDDADVVSIKAQIKQGLQHDPAARAKVLEALAKELDSMRQSGRIVVSAAAVNLTRYAPGPVEVVHGRYLAIARNFLARLPAGLEDFLSQEEVGDLQRLAVVVVLLVATECVLNLADMPPLIEALQTEAPQGHLEETGDAVRAQMRIRATIEGRTAIYDRTCDLSDKAALAAIGYIDKRQSDGVIAWKAIRREVDRLLIWITDDRDFDLKRLIEVMNPYWLLRVSGAAYACAIGQIESTAESERSTRGLLGEQLAATPVALAKKGKEGPPPARANLSEPAQAKAAVRLMMSSARGVVEKHQASSRRQRKELRRLFERGLDPILADWMSRQAVIESWVEFIRHLLENGGPRTDFYAFSSLPTYQSRVFEELVDEGWNDDVVAMSGEERELFYGRVLERVAESVRFNARTVLRIFDDFLRVKDHVQPCAAFPSARRPKRLARSVVIAQTSIALAVQLALTRHRPRGEFDKAAAGIIGLNGCFGLRTMEGFGSRHSDFRARHVMDSLRVRPNTTRGTKTGNGDRLITFNVGCQDMRDAANRAHWRSRSDEHRTADTAVFADPADLERLLHFSEVRARASWALKVTAGDASAILYSLRHTYACLVGCCLLMPEPEAPIAAGLALGVGLRDDLLKQLRRLEPTPRMIGANIDRLGMWLGQAGVETYLGTYCHVVWWVISDCCFKQAQKEPWTDGVVAALLGRDRTAVVVRRKAAGGDCLAEQLHRVAAYYIRRLRLPPVATRGASAKAEGGDALPTLEPLPLSLADAVLSMRRHDGFDFANLAQLMTSRHGVTTSSVEQFLQGYARTLNDTRFTDFEPDGNATGRQTRRGLRVMGGLRGELLRKIEAKLSDAVFLEQTRNIGARWPRHADPDRPLLVSRSEAQLLEDVEWLVRLGYERSAVHVHCAGIDEQARARLEAIGLKLEDAADCPIGRMKPVVPLLEFGIDVREPPSLPAMRGLQRVFFVVAAWNEAGMFLDTRAEG